MSDKDVKEAVEGTLKLFPAADQHALIVCAELMDIELSKSQAANQQLVEVLETGINNVNDDDDPWVIKAKLVITNAKQQEKGDE